MILKFRFVVLVLLVITGVAFSATSRLEGFAVPFPIQDATIFDGKLYLATSSGIRTVSSSGESSLYTAEDGLEFSSFVSVCASAQALYVVSRQGAIARLPKGGNSFQVINRSFLEQGIQALPSLSVIEGKIMVVGLENKVAFFDLENEEFLISLSKIGDSRLDVQSPTALAIHGDSLLVASGKVVYVRKMNWENLKTDRYLADPGTWEKIETKNLVGSIAIDSKGNIKTREQRGTFVWSDKLKIAASEDTSTIILDGDKLKLSDLYKNDSSRVQWVLPFEDDFFFVGSNYIAFGSANKVKDFSLWQAYQLGPVYELTALPNGGIIASGNNSMLSYIDAKGNFFSEPMPSNEIGWSNAFDGPNHLMKTLSVLPQGQLYYGLWGLGGFIYENYKSSNLRSSVTATSGSCVENFLENYFVSASAIPAPDSSGFLISYWGKEAYGLAFINLYGDIFCAPAVGSSSFAGAMVARKAEGSSDWEIYVSSGKTAALNGTGNIDKFLLEEPSRSGFSLRVIEHKTIATPENGFVLDMAFDGEGRLWGVTYSNIGFMDSNDSLRVPHRISQFSASAFSAIAIDPQGNPWVASNGQGVFRLQKNKNSVDTLFATRLKTRDGLLSENVYDIALDSLTGSIWFAQDLGITRLERNDLRSAVKFMTDSASNEVTVYPNPFKPSKHQKIIFDYVSENATISIYNAGGKLVQFFNGKDLEGGRAEWDAKDNSGRMVAPGLYHYLVKKGSKVKKGRLLIVY